MQLNLHLKPFSFRLNKTLKTSNGVIEKKQGWLIHLENPSGQFGWGEVSPFNIDERNICGQRLYDLGTNPSRDELENCIGIGPAALAFGLGAALAELDGLVGTKTSEGWLNPPGSAVLLPENKSLLNEIDYLLANSKGKNFPITFKWKVAIEPVNDEQRLLHQILKRLPLNARLRVDANAGWNREEANAWATLFHQEPRLEWLEQPLPADDLEGLTKLLELVPIALDESLIRNPSLRKSWKYWQVRRPLIDGDPRLLLKELEQGVGYRVISTAFETGIGRRWLNHLARLQLRGPTPTAPGLAPGWCPQGPLFSFEPELVWKAA